MAAADATAQPGGGFPGGGMGGGVRAAGLRATSSSNSSSNSSKGRRPNPETGANMLEQTIEELRIDLKLQPTQVPSWETYVGKARLLAGTSRASAC